MRVLFGHNKDQGGHSLAGHWLSNAGGALAAYAIAGVLPSYVMDTENGIYYDGTYYDGPNQLHDHATTSRRTVVDSDGLIKWAPHNVLLRSENADNASWTKINATVSSNLWTATSTTGPQINQAGSANLAGTYTIDVTLTYGTETWVVLYLSNSSSNFVAQWVNLASGTLGSKSEVGSGWSGTSSIEALGGNTYRIKLNVTKPATGSSTYSPLHGASADASFTGVIGQQVTFVRAALYRSGLGGMQSTGDATDPTYVPTAGSAVYWMGTDHDPVTGEVRGVQGEPAATNLLLNSGTLSTQNVTTTNVAHTLHFTGTGTITLSGTSTAGPLVGTGTGESNRVSLTFTPTAGTLTLTVSGTVTNAQLETGSLPTSYIPTAGATATRAAPSVSKPLSEVSADLDEIVVVTEFECDAVAADAVVAALDDASTDLIHFRAHTSQANLLVQDGGVTQADVDAGAISANTQYRAAFKMASDDFLASLGGATAVADTSGTMPTPTTLRLFNSSGAGALAGIRLKKLIVYAGAAGALDAIDATAIEGAST